MLKWTCPLGCLAVALALAQEPPPNFAPPDPVKPTDEQTAAIKAKKDKLEKSLSLLARNGIHDPVLAEVEVFFKAAEWMDRHKEFYDKHSADWALEALDRGLLRAAQASGGETPWWNLKGHGVVRAYRSSVDGSVQPYAVTFPKDYGTDARKLYRIDVVLHGRDPSLNEVKFLHQHNGEKDAPADLDYIQIDIFGRGNNGYRWAGETDVVEALEHFAFVERGLKRDVLLDTKNVVLRGFSMGGAGTWHLGLHRPDKWSVLGPAAGFTTTRGYVKDLPRQLPAYQEDCLTIYDAAEYAENVFNVPVVAYSGEKDPQAQAARNIEERLKGSKITFKHLVAPGLGHRFPPEWQAKAEAEFRKYTTKERAEYPEHVRFVTFTLRYNRCGWVEILGLGRHYDKALVDARVTKDGYKITTKNVRTLHLTLKPGEGREAIELDVDEQTGKEKLSVAPFLVPKSSEPHLYLEKGKDGWRAVRPEKIFVGNARQVQKAPGRQGPIDDAFMTPFLLVRGTGTPWNKEAQAFADAGLKRFTDEWDKHFRGRLVVKDDREVTTEDVAQRHLVLFGDPGSNALTAQVLDGLPLRWDRKSITLGENTYDAATHVPVMIYPSPLNNDRYVVLNSGHTFRGADLKGTNALLYPRLGDYAILKRTPRDGDALAAEVAEAGLFDDFWRLKK